MWVIIVSDCNCSWDLIVLFEEVVTDSLLLYLLVVVLDLSVEFIFLPLTHLLIVHFSLGVELHLISQGS